MTKRKIILVLGACCVMALLAAQSLCQAGGSSQTGRSSGAKRQQSRAEAERQRESKKMTAEQKKQLQEAEEKTRKWREELPEKLAEAKREFLREKNALAAGGLTEEQWKLIKPKLEKVRQLRDQANSTVGSFLTSSSASGKKPGGAQSQGVPTWQWKISWKDKVPAELTEAQKNANTLLKLVDSRNATAKGFKQSMDSLRESRGRQKELEEELSRAREELRKALTPRQEAALVLMRWL